MVSGTLLDLANHVLGADLGSSFTTSDYSAPQVTKVDPSPKQPLTKNGEKKRMNRMRNGDARK